VSAGAAETPGPAAATDPHAEPVVLAARRHRPVDDAAYGVMYSWWLVGAGALILVIGFTGWALEPSVAD
jgi:hypothetical protein